jgi:hypothetical protein
LRRTHRRPSFPRRKLDILVLTAIYALLLSFFRPDLILSDTTATGGDMAAHIFPPWFLKEHLLAQGLVTGWSEGWFAGFPVLHFYFPLIPLIQALLAYVMPYVVAFKLGTILGTALLPTAAYATFRLLRFHRPAPIAASLFAFAFQFMTSFNIYGGNIQSSLVGEYAYSFSLALSLIFVGLAFRVVTDDEGPMALAALCLFGAVLSHLVPVLVLAMPACAYLVGFCLLKHRVRRGLRLLVVGGLGLCLTGFWLVPFVLRLSNTAGIQAFPIRGLGRVLPAEAILPAVLAGGAILSSDLRGDARKVALLVPTAVAGLLFVLAPSIPIWNGRFLPVWYLGLFLAAAFLFEGGRRAKPDDQLPLLGRWLPTSVGLGLLILFVLTWVLVKGFIGVVDDWIERNYSGYESAPNYSMFRDLMQTLENLPEGRVVFERAPILTTFGSPLADMSTPYWTKQASLVGINLESSLTTRFSLMTEAEIGHGGLGRSPDVPLPSFDMGSGVDHLKLLDVRYLVTASARATSAAQEIGLQELASVGELSIFQIESEGRVLVPAFEPVVLEDQDWLDANLEWFTRRDDLQVPLVREGPDEWTRVGSIGESLPRSPLAHGGSSYDVEVTDGEMVFRTDAVGEPHWVKTSFFPNWQVDGAQGPFLASPSMMMVIPTRPLVRLHYERTWVEWLGIAASFLGVSMTLVLAISNRRGPR